MSWHVAGDGSEGDATQPAPRLQARALAERLDEVVGPGGWSLRFQPFSAGVGCELTVAGVTRAAVAGLEDGGRSLEACSEAAFARAAELFGMRPPTAEAAWQEAAGRPDAAAAAAPEGPDGPGAAAPAGYKPEGQQAIDRLVERLRSEGKGLEAAKLLVEYGGYGGDPAAARELYARLRALLLGRGESVP